MNKLSRYSVLAPLILAAMQIAAGQAYGQSKPIDTDELTNRAEVVAVGKVTSLRSEWNKNRSRIVTRATVAVDQYLKGEQPQHSIVITVAGGEVGGVGELYSHSAKFKSNEDVVVFAERDSRGVLHVTGGEQGKISVTKDERTDKQMVSQQRTLDEFKTQIRLAAQRQKNSK